MATKPIKSRTRTAKKFYAMRRMREAIERAIRAPTAAEKGRAARWAAAWGTAAGIPGASKTWH